MAAFPTRSHTHQIRVEACPLDRAGGKDGLDSSSAAADALTPFGLPHEASEVRTVFFSTFVSPIRLAELPVLRLNWHGMRTIALGTLTCRASDVARHKVVNL
jgi:hypothetical protein